MSSPGRSSVGRYELRERLGAGGMGTVWRAWDPTLRRDVAVKEVLLPEGMDTVARAEAHARTLREAQATARIHSTAVVAVHDVLEHDASPWIVMELLSGASLQHHLEHDGPMAVTRVEEAAAALLGGLRAAHAVGVTHRDVKPANIMLTEDDRTVLTDFGIANVDGGAALTQTGVYIGSPEYMAPERFEGERALPASDLWSLGVTLFSLLEGRSPFKRDSITGIITAVLTAPVPPQLSATGSEGGSASAPMRSLIAALLVREPSERPTPTEALALLEREKRERDTVVPDGRPPQAPAAPGTGPQDAAHGVSGAQPSHVPQESWPASGPPGPQQPRPPFPGGPPGNAHAPNPAAAHTAWGRPPNGPHAAPAAVPRGGPATGRYAQGAGLPGFAARPGAGQPGGVAGFTAAPGRGGAAVPGGWGAWGDGAPDMPKPASVIAAAVMVGFNALVLMVLTAHRASVVLSGDDEYNWGTVLLLGTWGLFSAFAAVGLMTRSRVLYGAVVIVQIVASVLLLLTMFPVLVYSPEELLWHGIVLVFNLVIGGLLLIPAKARAFFGLGS